MTICKKYYWEEKGMLAGQGFTEYTCSTVNKCKKFIVLY